MTMHYWKIDHDIIEKTEHAFQIGEHEVFAIWTSKNNSVIQQNYSLIDDCIIPIQTPGASTEGVWVHIDGSELQRIQLENFHNSRRSIIQLHTHPGSDVRMSALDRTWEVVRHIGALSIIVPFYGRNGLSLATGSNVYEREETDWRLWSPAEVKERLVIR